MEISGQCYMVFLAVSAVSLTELIVINGFGEKK